MKTAGVLVTGVVGGLLAAPQAAPPARGNVGFNRTIRPFVANHCASCHNPQLKTGGLNLSGFSNAAAVEQNRAVWQKVLHKLRSGEMPPPAMPRPALDQVARVTAWIEARLKQSIKAEPGRVTARRLNRAEYNYTVRDLLGVEASPADDFPIDDSGYGFDNIGDVLSLSPVLMEKYLAAAEKLASLAIVTPAPIPATLERYQTETLGGAAGSPISLTRKHRFPAEAEYDFKVGVGRRPDRAPPIKLALLLDGKQVTTFDVDAWAPKPREFDVRIRVPAGEHLVAAAYLPETAEYNPASAPARPAFPKPREDAVEKYMRDRKIKDNLVMDYIEIRGPFNAAPPPPPESHRRIFVCGHLRSNHDPGCARTIVTSLARRAWRRPATAAEVDELLPFTDIARKQGESFEQGIRLALEAMLISPHFLFRIERDPPSGAGGPVHRVSDLELASRLSYFLWSSIPDEELLAAAERRQLRKPAAFMQQIRRMLADLKSQRLVENFGAQWLQLRNLRGVQPDPQRFPEFNEELRDSMHRETLLFFEAILREDRSILDFLDADFTFVNERLARLYGIPGVTGSEFRRVTLKGEQRGGVLTHASVLTVSSHPTRTSPVLRGKWILETLLNAPPPPPPPGVQQTLNEASSGKTGTLRQLLEKHRSSPSCYTCHARMDPLGFGLENYNAIGAWRTHEGEHLLDSTGTLPDGQSFRGPAQLKAILKRDRDAFARGLTEKLLTFALGRGVEEYDQPAVDAIGRQLAAKQYRFSALVEGIVNSMPFQMRRSAKGGDSQ